MAQKSFIVIDDPSDNNFTPVEGCKLVTVTSGRMPTTAHELLSNPRNVIQDLDAFANTSNGGQFEHQPGYAQQTQQMQPGQGTIRRSWSGTRTLQPA